MPREIAILRSTLGNPAGAINFFASYGSDTNFMSNESVPGESFNGGGNPGFDNNGTFQSVVHANYDQFVMTIPEPGAFLLCGAVAALAASVAVKKRLSHLRVISADRSE